MDTTTTPEKPLSNGAKLALVCGATATILLFYLFVLVSIVVLSALMLVELALLLVALRVGAAGIFARLMEWHVRLLGVFFTSLWLGKGTQFQIPLRPEDAPRLFDLLRGLCGRLAIQMPQEVCLQLGVNAWVQLKGLQRGKGRTVLGIGYDLLAGLTETEIEAVLAHEMVHAKLIQRGFKTWLASSVGRMAKLSGSITGMVEAGRQSKNTFLLGGLFLPLADNLTRLAVRLFAAYSRQDEFDADRGAAELCGSGPIRSSLSKLDALEQITQRLPLSERVARLQLEGGFSQWLVRELAEARHSNRHDEEVFNKYATHPLLRDRLAALPPASGPEPQGQPSAVQLLARADEVAAKLINEIQRVLAEQEQKDSKQLRGWTAKARRTSNLRPAQSAGVALWVVALLGGLAAWATVGGVAAIVTACVCIGIGTALYRWGRYEDRVTLPIPDYSALVDDWKKANKVDDFEAAQKAIEEELKLLVATEKKARRKLEILVKEAYAALGKCHYLRAHVAARQCIAIDSKSIEGALALAIASAAVGQTEQAFRLLNVVQHHTGLRSVSTIWGGAWVLVLAGDHAHAEAFLEEALKEKPSENTFRLLLAFSQSRRGKLQSAIMNARQACEHGAQTLEQTKLLIKLLLDGGYLREAGERLVELGAQVKQDEDLMLAMVRIQLTRQDFAAAAQWADQLKATNSETSKLMRLGHTYERARRDAEAATYFHEALATGHYPEAHFGLGRLESVRGNKAEARTHLLAALNFEQEPAKNAAGPLPLVPHVIGKLLELTEPQVDCKAWIVQLPGGQLPEGIANRSFMVYARERNEAAQHLTTLLDAIKKGATSVNPAHVVWHIAPRQHQPDGPVRPGVQGFFG